MPTFLRGRWGEVLAAVLAVGLAVVVVAALSVVVRDRLSEAEAALAVTVLSSRPDAVTGGDARVLISVPPGVPTTDVRVTLNGTDVTRQFRASDAGLEGLVAGMTGAVNTLEASSPSARGVIETLVDHPVTGPLFSGPHQQPYVCQTEAFRTRTGVRLGPPSDDDCSVGGSLSYVYLSTRKKRMMPIDLLAVTDPRRRPADIAMLDTPRGRRPFIVRVETVAIDRGIAQIAVLDDEEAGTPTWNRKLAYLFGGGCGGGYRQGTRAVGVLSPNLLGQGYAVASNSLNAFEQNCNDVLASEAFAMTREHVIERYGTLAYTMGLGCSGGAAQAYQTADNYPGLLDGIVVGCSVADLGFDVGQLVFDARLLQKFADRFPGRLRPDQLVAVSGLSSLAALRASSDAATILDPVAGFDPAVPRSVHFDPVHNVGGARATVWDQAVNVYGPAADSDRARRPLGNVGVQYGLQALRDGAIGVEDFLDLNASIGGLNVDLGRTARRTTADGQATRRAYATGRLLNGGGGLTDIPIIDYRAYRYDGHQAPLDLAHHSFTIRERLLRATGDAANQVILTDTGHGRFDLETGVVAESIQAMDRWITAIKRLPYAGHRAVVDARPADLTDGCVTPDGRRIAEARRYGGDGECDRLYPAAATPRMVAGGPLGSDVVACALTPADPQSYGRPFTADQARRLAAIFPTGVCDWSRGGQWQRGLSGAWQQF